MNTKNIEKLKISVAQIKLVTGDLEGNTKRIIDNIYKAISDKTDILVFPELSITAYNCGLLFNQINFLKNQINFLNNNIIPIVPNNLVVILGYVRIIGKKFDGYPQIANSAIVIQGGKVLGYSDKILLANGGHHEDLKYFTPGNIPSPITVKVHDEELNIGLVVCEDIFYKDHRRNIPKEIVQNGAEILIAVNQSFFYYEKQNIRKEICQFHALENNLYFVYVNNVGVGDISKNFIIYDGGSMIISPNGSIVVEANRFEETLITATLNQSPVKRKPKFENKFHEIYESLVYAQKEIFKDLGLKKAQIHVSGGIDSSVVLPILVEAMGVENVIAISNPSEYNGDVTKNNAQYICDKLGVKLYWNEIGSVEKALELSHKKAFGENSVKPLVLSTFDAVGRTVQGLAASHTFGTGIVATGNHTEIVLGWSNFHDIGSIGVMSIIGDLTKVEIFQLAKYINEKFGQEIIPKNLYDGSTLPAAELADANQDPWNYYVVSGICALLIRHMSDIVDIIEMYKTKSLPEDYFPNDPSGKSIYEIVNLSEFEKQVKICYDRCRISVYKSAQGAPVLILAPISRGFSTREVLINQYKGYYDDTKFNFNKKNNSVSA